MNEEYVSFVQFIVTNNHFATCARKKSCFKYIADVDTLGVYFKSGGKEWGEVGEQVSSWDLPLAYQGGEKSLFMITFLIMAIC